MLCLCNTSKLPVIVRTYFYTCSFVCLSLWNYLTTLKLYREVNWIENVFCFYPYFHMVVSLHGNSKKCPSRLLSKHKNNKLCYLVDIPSNQLFTKHPFMLVNEFCRITLLVNILDWCWQIVLSWQRPSVGIYIYIYIIRAWNEIIKVV